MQDHPAPVSAKHPSNQPVPGSSADQSSGDIAHHRYWPRIVLAQALQAARGYGVDCLVDVVNDGLLEVLQLDSVGRPPSCAGTMEFESTAGTTIPVEPRAHGVELVRCGMGTV